MNNHIFISYSSKDKKIAFELVDYLESNGVKCWIAPRNIVSGHDYTDTIDDAIKHCDGIVLIFSNFSAKSIWVKKEITLGVSHQKNVIPFKITNTETDGGFNFMLNNLQWIDGTSHPVEKFPEIIEGLKRYDADLTNVTPKPIKHDKKRYPIIIGAACVIAIGVAVPLISGSRDSSTPEDSLPDSVMIENESAATTFSDESPHPEHSFAQPEHSVAKTNVKNSEIDKKPKNSETENTARGTETLEIEKTEVTTPSTEPTVTKEDTPKAQETVPKKDLRYGKAVKLYNAKHYKDALKLFEELKSTGSKEPYIDSYISNCKEKLN